MNITKVQIPCNEQEDINKNVTEWRDGKMVRLNCKTCVKLYLDHEYSTYTDEDGNEHQRCDAWEITVSKPVTRDKAIDAAEREAYGLKNADDVASFNASLSRKFREAHARGEVDEQVVQHDSLIEQVKCWLKDIGI